METIAVIISSYGEREKWNQYAQRALLSVANQTRPPDAVIRYHGESLHQSRNHSASLVDTDWLLFLDSDDQIEPQYLQSMMAEVKGDNELLYPAVRYVSEALVDPKYEPEPVILPSRPLWTGNYMVIGTLIRRDLFIKIGGFRELRAYEDWDLWIRAWLNGATPRLVKDAIYRAMRRPDSRNIVSDPMEIFKKIVSDNQEYAQRIL